MMQSSPWILAWGAERPHGRKSFPRQERMNRGSLNLFAPSPGLPLFTPAKKTSKESFASPSSVISCAQAPSLNSSSEEAKIAPSIVTTSHQEESSSDKAAAPRAPALSSPSTGVVWSQESRECSYSSSRRGKYINQESSATREFPTLGRRRVLVTPRPQHGEGLKIFKNPTAAHQSIQVVNITPAYRDPTTMSTPRSGLRCVSRTPSCPSEIKEVIEYKGASQQLTGNTLQVPIGQAVKKWQKNIPRNSSNLEKFLQAVRNRCEERAKGVTQFYVLLCRNMIGGSTPSTPRVETSQLWELDQPPIPNKLTLIRCLEQLVSLTSISISLVELATLIWGSSVLQEENGSKMDEEDLQNHLVSYVDFSNAFRK